jgi:hypothetical protein
MKILLALVAAATLAGSIAAPANAAVYVWRGAHYSYRWHGGYYHHRHCHPYRGRAICRYY